MATTHESMAPFRRLREGPQACTAPLSLPHAHLSGYTDGDHSVLLLGVGLDDVTLQANGGPSRPGEKSRVAPRSTQDPR